MSYKKLSAITKIANLNFAAKEELLREMIKRGITEVDTSNMNVSVLARNKAGTYSAFPVLWVGVKTDCNGRKELVWDISKEAPGWSYYNPVLYAELHDAIFRSWGIKLAPEW